MTKIAVIPCLEDNYAYLIVNDQRQAVLIDCPEAAPIALKIAELNVELVAILITHHHHDHVDGLADLATGSAKSYGAKADAHRLPDLDHELSPNDSVTLAGMRFGILEAYGHTIGHIAFYMPDEKALFTADSLMIWGCGRLFEGTPAQMMACFENFAKLPEDTLVFSGHNYAEANGRFAQSLGGYQNRMDQRMEKINEQNKLGLPVCPVLLSEELNTNPYYLIADDEYAKELGIEAMSKLERFTHVRKLKDAF